MSLFNRFVLETAEEVGLPKATVHRIIRSVFSYINYCIKNEINFRLKYFGTFIIKEKRKEAMLKLNETHSKRRQSNST